MLIRRQGSTLGRGSHKAKQLTGHGTSCLSSGVHSNLGTLDTKGRITTLGP